MEASESSVEVIFNYFSDFTPQQIEQFKQLEAVYTEWNEKINVISRKDIGSLYTKHILHSLAIVTEFQFVPGTRIVDIGTGGGFPGIPLAIFFPEAEFHLVDSIGKKIKVVDEAVQALGLKNVTTYHTRVETMPKQNFDFAVSRAVAPLRDLWTWAKPLLRNNRLAEDVHKNGLVCLKGGDLRNEIRESGMHPHLWDISSVFEEPYFQDKFIVYVPIR